MNERRHGEVTGNTYLATQPDALFVLRFDSIGAAGSVLSELTFSCRIMRMNTLVDGA